MDKTQIDPRSLLCNATENAITALSRGGIEFVEHSNADGSTLDDLPFYSGHSHTHTEMVFVFNGKATVMTGNQWFVPRRRRVYALLPGVMHSEKTGSSGGYDLLWIIPRQKIMAMHITAYRPGRGYFLHPVRVAFNSTIPVNLANSLSASVPGHELTRIRFQALLIDTLFIGLETINFPQDHSASYQQQVVELVHDYIQTHACEQLSLKQLGAMVHYNPAHLNELFKKQYGTSVYRFVLDSRMEEASRLVATTDMPIKEVALSVGFNDPLYFSRLFRKRHGVSPSRMRG